MTAAIFAARNGKKVVLIEKNNKLGRKIAASGNGKCNLTNADLSTACYHHAYESDMEKLLEQYNTEIVLGYMKSLGIVCKEKKGYYYPMSEQAAVVVQMLQAELEHLRVEVVLEERFCDATKEKNNWIVFTDKSTYRGRRLILSCGGMAAPKLGAEGTGYAFLKKQGHTIRANAPALVQLTAKERYIKKISGVRTEAKICLKAGKQSYFEEGEIIFTDTGISGIPVFQLSRYVTEAVRAGECVELSVNVIPSCDTEQLIEDVLSMARYNPKLPLEYLFRGFCNHKLVYALLVENGYDPEAFCGRINESSIVKLIHLFRAITFRITGTNGFEQAQVTRGGVPLDEICMDTMESRRVSELYVTGELLDVDGICGGYNLHFAWTSGMIAGTAQNE